MARIVLGSYMVRYPLGGMMSWVLQYLRGFHELGHEVFLVEKSGYANACYDPITNRMSDDCRAGTQATNALLARFDLSRRWCFVDAAETYHGLSRADVEAVCASADLFIDMGTHGAWQRETERAGLRVLLDGEPAFSQLKLAKRQASGEAVDAYDFYYTSGANVGTAQCNVSGAGKPWRHLFHPVVTRQFALAPCQDNAPFTTVMNWQSYEPVEYNGCTLYHKDVEFAKFMSLPGRTRVPLEVAVAGEATPFTELEQAGWPIRDAHDVTATFDRFVEYLATSRGEFSVCKSGYVTSNTGWFSDRSAAYLAAGRPVVLQDTGFSAHLPCGRGLFAVQTVEEAADALETIASDYSTHARAARELAVTYLEAANVLGKFLQEIGL
jgi:hypothetical protein